MQNFSILNSYFKHITRKHPDFHRENFGRNTETIIMNDNDLPNNDETLPDTEALDEDLCADIDYENIVAMFLLELREVRKVSGIACSFVATSVINLIKLALHIKVQSVLLKLDELQINNPDLHENVLADEINLINALTKFSLIKNLDNYIRQKSTFVPPVELNSNAVVDNYDTFQYIPILETLKILCNEDDVLGHVLCPSVDDGKIHGFRNGTLFKNSEFFIRNPSALQIFLYTDEFVPVNKLSNKVKKHKISAFYFTIGNIPRPLRSRLNDINLAILCKNEHLSSYGYSAILAPLIKDLQHLELTGISFNNHGVNLCGSLALLVADNLAAHAIGGFNECFSPVVKKGLSLLQWNL